MVAAPSPPLRTENLLPRMEERAPERTDTSKGSTESPNLVRQRIDPHAGNDQRK